MVPPAAPSPSRTTRRAASALRRRDVEALRSVAVRFGPDHEAAKRRALGHAAGCALADAAVVAAYHDALLFLLAYPGARETRALAARELERVAEAAASTARRTPAAGRRALDGSGIAGTEVTASFSRTLCAWLARRHAARADVTSFGDGSRLAAVLALCLPPMETEVTGTAGGALALLDAIRGSAQSRLAALVDALASLPAGDAVRDDLFDSAQPFVTIRPGATPLSRTFARGPAREPFLHEAPLVRALADPAAVIREPLQRPTVPDRRGQRAWVDLARATLAMLARETDPVTWPSVEGVSVYDLGRGATLALFPMHPSRRFALDAHTGYLLLKNGLPVAYGGGWPFLATCRTGVNVFAAYRGGESAWLFARTLAAYRQHFGTKRFVVEPYQFGAGNREGLLSGAFWFYYRLGFRPVEPDVARLARTELARLARKGYRPPLATMRALTASDLALDVEPSTAAERTEPADVSLAVTRWIVRSHGGDRARAQRDAAARVASALGTDGLARWPRAERDAFRSLALAFGLIADLGSWSAGDKAACVALMRDKGRADDAPFVRALLAHPRLAPALAAVAAGC